MSIEGPQPETASGEGSIREAVGDADNVLLLAPAMDGRVDGHCASLLSVAAPEDLAVLWVTMDDAPDDRIDVWRAHVGGLPAETGIVHVGGESRSTAASAQAPGAGGPPSGPTAPEPVGGVSIASVSSPGDLTGLGIEISGYCSRWAEREEDIVACVHGLSSLLQFTDVDRTFRFLHTITGRFAAVGATAHYHLDPSAHDDRTVNKLKMLFDAVVELDDDGCSVGVR